ncbi:MAG: alcohol dehydrogenase catalytic domain-containing protein, partial [Caldilineaceae bacterium]|nr:alcohol dehydrogenase catalytic domain-containing protein [Caldilineaceae bacterium]
MQAAVWYARNDIRIETAPDPRPPGPHEMIIKVGACGICGTDLEEYRAGPLFIPVDEPNPLTGSQAPLILGHEFAGEVIEVGNAVSAYRPGDRIAPDVLITCGECYWCQRHQVTLCDKLAALGLMGDGGLADYCVVPTHMCIRLPNGLSYDHAAMAEPLSVAVRAVRKGRLTAGESVAIFGGGTIGLFCLQAARAAGAGDIFVIEPLANRRALAKELGANEVIDPFSSEVGPMLRNWTRGVGPDRVGEQDAVSHRVAVAEDVLVVDEQQRQVAEPDDVNGFQAGDEREVAFIAPAGLAGAQPHVALEPDEHVALGLLVQEQRGHGGHRSRPPRTSLPGTRPWWRFRRDVLV